MESQAFEQPPQATPQQSRPQSYDVNAISRTSKAEGERSYFLLITFFLGFSSWIISLVSQAIVAATISNAAVRLLWFGIVIQFILLVEILEVVISGNVFAYGIQISIFAGLATVFAVLGADENIYASSRAQKGTGAGWLITAIINLLWIIYFTSPSDSHFIRFATFASFGPPHLRRPEPVEKVTRGQDAFVMSPPNGGSDVRPDAEALKELGLDGDQYATLAAVDVKEERVRGSERTSGYRLEDIGPQRAPRTMSGGLWSNYTSSQQGGLRSSGVTNGDGGVEKEASALGSERPESGTASVSAPETPSRPPAHSKASQSKASRIAPQPLQPVNEPTTQWRAEALFDYPGAPDDSNELSFKKGEHLTIIDKSGKWWEAKTMDGRKGIAPSNYLRLLI